MSVEPNVDPYGPGPTAPTAPSFVVKRRNGRSYPRLACAGCGELITDVEMAGVVWHPKGLVEEGTSPITVLCKTNHCLGRDPRWKHWWWQPLSYYLIWLLENTGAHPPKKFRALVTKATQFSEMFG